MKMLKFEQKMRGSTNVCFITKVGIDQNVGICLKTKELILIRILKFEDKIGNRSKCWNLSANHQITKMMYCEWKVLESIKKLTFGCNKVGIDQNVEIWVQNVKSIKMLKFEQKRWRLVKCWYSIAKVEIDQIIGNCLKNKELIRILKFEDNIKNQSKCWNLSAKCQVDQNAEIWVKKEDWSECQKFEWKGGINKNIEIWRQSWESIKMLKFER